MYRGTPGRHRGKDHSDLHPLYVGYPLLLDHCFTSVWFGWRLEAIDISSDHFRMDLSGARHLIDGVTGQTE